MGKSMERNSETNAKKTRKQLTYRQRVRQLYPTAYYMFGEVRYSVFNKDYLKYYKTEVLASEIYNSKEAWKESWKEILRNMLDTFENA